MLDEIKKEEEIAENAEKALVDEIANLDPTGDDTPLDVSTDKDEDESKTVGDEEKKDETVDKDKKSVDESKEGSGDEKKKEEDTKAPEEKKDEDLSEKDKDKKPDEEGETKKEVSQIDKLLAEIDRLSGSEIPVEVPKEKKKVPEGEKKVDELVSDKEAIHDFIKDIDMDDVSSDPEVFNKILHAVVAKVQQQTTEQVLRSIPEVVMSQVRQQTYFKKMADDFYDDNKDLINVKQVVRACAQQLQKNNPEWEVEKIFSEAATKTRETLGMSAHVIDKEEEPPSADDAAFAKQKGGSKSNLKQKKSSLQSEIDEL